MDSSKVRYSGSVGIRVQVRTTGHGTYMLVHRADGNYNSDPDKLRVSWDHELNGNDNAVAAVQDYLRRKSNDTWDGHWVIAGADKASWVAVRAEAW